MEDAEHVARDDCGRLVAGYFVRRKRCRVVGGAVDGTVQSTITIDGKSDECGDGRRFAHVTPVEGRVTIQRAQFPLGLRTALRVARSHDDPGTARDESLGRCQADTRGATGNQRNFVFEVFHAGHRSHLRAGWRHQNAACSRLRHRR